MSNITDSFLVDLKHTGDLSNNEKGDLATISGKDNLIQAIMNRLITVKGTIVHRPEYGIGIKSYQGSISSLERQRNLALDIKNQLTDDDRIESVDGVRIVANDEVAGEFQITLKITANGIGEIEETFNPFE